MHFALCCALWLVVGMFLCFFALALYDEFAHALAGAVYLSLYSTHWQVQFLGYLVVGVVLKESHRKEAAVILRQRLDVVLYLSALLLADHVLLGSGCIGYGCGELFVDGEILLTASLKVDMCVARNGIDPLSEGVLG